MICIYATKTKTKEIIHVEHISKEMLEFIRQQNPKGTRIRLYSMPDDPQPIEGGSLGTLQFIDDLGTFHVKWDNGRTLGLVVGKDSFSTLPPLLHELKLYMKLTGDYFSRNEWGELYDNPDSVDGKELARYRQGVLRQFETGRHPAHSNRRGKSLYVQRTPRVHGRLRDLDETDHWAVSDGLPPIHDPCCRNAGVQRPSPLGAWVAPLRRGGPQGRRGFWPGYQHQGKPYVRCLHGADRGQYYPENRSSCLCRSIKEVKTKDGHSRLHHDGESLRWHRRIPPRSR